MLRPEALQRCRYRLGLSFALVVLTPALGWAEDPPSSGLEQKDAEVIKLRLSEQTVLSADGVRSYSEGTMGVVDVRLTRDGHQFVLVGQRAGVTSLLLIMMDGTERHFRIEVSDPHSQNETESLRVTREENIRLDFYFVQINRSKNLDLGAHYPRSVTLGSASASFDFLTQRFQSATAVIEDQALLRLDMAQSVGWAKLTRQAALITENGKRAVFYGGGEVNIPVQGSLTTGIHTIDYGSTIDVLPRYDSDSGRLQIELSADVSDLTDDQGSGAPGRVRSTLSTVVNVESGQAVVLAGLKASSKLTRKSGVPGLSQIPIFGLLFGSKNSSEQMADNVVFIVPTVVETTSVETREKIDIALRLFREHRGQREHHESIHQLWSEP